MEKMRASLASGYIALAKSGICRRQPMAVPRLVRLRGAQAKVKKASARRRERASISSSEVETWQHVGRSRARAERSVLQAKAVRGKHEKYQVARRAARAPAYPEITRSAVTNKIAPR
ncbi:uncharacterized protein MYCFIDRAFT_176715 [Pseudocercospora fijiensis CIRAD86]|uniref:Uncharacterized protein n=1 Tax=Pseudocercospora fijiensis (strain CIRAD86) TaxID=383855 RepID=M3AWD6_PSEFD|nr:uncharacterized protein MYCFIDRAFT_176715 [Pseudocercospora fijiensis CIRAD86]EME81443.1 hypothetical protein MYCFIDRAFT_176715 [Pseudocercospora fijiensis CIRAD86]